MNDNSELKNKRREMVMSGGNNSKKRSQRLLMLVVALAMATVCVMLLHKLREGRVFGLIVKEQDEQISTLQLFLQRERERSKAIKWRLEDAKGKNYLLRNQNKELSTKLMEAQAVADQLQKIQEEMKASLDEKQNQINGLTEKSEESIRANTRVADLTERLKQSETELGEMKQQLEKLRTVENNRVPQAEAEKPTMELSEKTEASDANAVVIKQSEETRNDGKWVRFQTNSNDEVSEEISEEKLTDSQHNEEEEKRGEMRQLDVKEQSEELQQDKQETDKSITEIEETKSDEVKSKIEEPGADTAKEGEQEKNEEQVASKVQTTRTRRNKSRGKGRRRRSATRARELGRLTGADLVKTQTQENMPENNSDADNKIVESYRYESNEKNKLEGEQKETDSGRAKLEIPEIPPEIPQEGQSNSEAQEEKRASSEQQAENAQNNEDSESTETSEGDKVGDNSNINGRSDSEATAETQEQKIASIEQQSEKARDQEDGGGPRVRSTDGSPNGEGQSNSEAMDEDRRDKAVTSAEDAQGKLYDQGQNRTKARSEAQEEKLISREQHPENSDDSKVKEAEQNETTTTEEKFEKLENPQDEEHEIQIQENSNTDDATTIGEFNDDDEGENRNSEDTA